MTAQDDDLTIRPITPKFGAEISGVDITGPLDEATRAEILAAQNEWGVTVWRGTGLDDPSHVAFSRIFGELMTAPCGAYEKNEASPCYRARQVVSSQ